MQDPNSPAVMLAQLGANAPPPAARRDLAQMRYRHRALLAQRARIERGETMTVLMEAPAVSIEIGGSYLLSAVDAELARLEAEHAASGEAPL